VYDGFMGDFEVIRDAAATGDAVLRIAYYGNY
jgi:hypothetical protein